MPRLVYGFRSYFPCYPKTGKRIYSQRSLFIVCITADFILEIFNSEGSRRRCAIQNLKLELHKFRLEICGFNEIEIIQEGEGDLDDLDTWGDALW